MIIISLFLFDSKYVRSLKNSTYRRNIEFTFELNVLIYHRKSSYCLVEYVI